MSGLIITCPNCKNQFEPGDSMRDEIEKELRNKMVDWQKKKDEEYRKRETELEKQLQLKDMEIHKKLAEEKQKLQVSIEETLRKDIGHDFENQVKILQQSNKDNEEKLKLARAKELEFLEKEQALKAKEEEMELSLRKRLNEEREKLSVEIREIEKQKLETIENDFRLKLAEKEKQLEDQRKLAEEMRRKAEQGSMQLQGEVQELLLEGILKEHFPFDLVEEVGKGVEGADCILVVRNKAGHECGKIIFESKRTKAWSNIWVEKLKNDMRSTQADLAILVSQVFPKGMECFGEKDGVWICSFKEVIGMTSALRNAIIRISETKKSEENKGEKMQMLYNYLTGIEFRQQIEAIVEGFVSMKGAITKERIQMEKIWKEREKQLDKVLLNTSGLYGSIKGIAGTSVGSIPLLEEVEEDEGDTMVIE
ncbi:MAG: hypothetical protein JWN76_2169 [Chitinophagaceae bacterium]|nr:hypothetical protein [Chitinophagaceae bacterium]